MIWSENYCVNSHDVDVNGILSASGVMRYLEESAYQYFAGNPPSIADMRKMGVSFILSKFSLCLYSPVKAKENITVETWSCANKGLSLRRCYRMLREGVIAAEMSSVWALVRLSDRRLLRTEEIGMPSYDEAPLELEAPVRIRIPHDTTMSLIGERAIVYSDLDENKHMNNTKYPDMLCDFMPSMAGKRAVTLSIHFINEAVLGETIKIYHGESDGTSYFRTVKPDGTPGIEAEMIFDEIY